MARKGIEFAGWAAPPAGMDHEQRQVLIRRNLPAEQLEVPVAVLLKWLP
jgi:hypothetical protein